MNIVSPLLLFPRVLEHLYDLIEAVLNSKEGPLPLTWRYYIGIMTISQKNC